jgi:hypothetical protein
MVAAKAETKCMSCSARTPTGAEEPQPSGPGRSGCLGVWRFGGLVVCCGQEARHSSKTVSYTADCHRGRRCHRRTLGLAWVMA